MAQQKKNGSKAKGAKPWEKMNSAKKEGEKKEQAPKKEFLDFLYLLPKKVTAKQLAGSLEFLKKDCMEVWDEECVLEITTEHGGTITFEDIRESLEKEDEKTLSSLRMKQVLSCDYEASDRELVQKVMTVFLQQFEGKIGTDTEDFSPFLTVEEL